MGFIEPRLEEDMVGASTPPLGNARPTSEEGRVTIPNHNPNLVPDATTTTPPRTIPDEDRLRQQPIASFLLPNEVGTCASLAQASTHPPSTNTAEEVNNFEVGTPPPTTRNPLVQDVLVDLVTTSNAVEVPGTVVGTGTTSSTNTTVTPSLDKPTATDEKKENCSYKRGGWCNVHNKVGIKSIRQSKCWKKKKDGSFGYVTSKKVEYKCESTTMRKPALPTGSSISETDGVQNNGSNYTISTGLSSTLEVELSARIKSESIPPDIL